MGRYPVKAALALRRSPSAHVLALFAVALAGDGCLSLPANDPSRLALLNRALNVAQGRGVVCSALCLKLRGAGGTSEGARDDIVRDPASCGGKTCDEDGMRVDAQVDECK